MSRAPGGDERDAARRGLARASTQLCEVAIPEAGFEGSWYTARKLRRSGNRWLVKYDELEASDESGDKLQEWVSDACVRPAPPTEVDGWSLERLSPGDSLEVRDARLGAHVLTRHTFIPVEARFDPICTAAVRGRLVERSVSWCRFALVT